MGTRTLHRTSPELPQHSGFGSYPRLRRFVERDMGSLLPEAPRATLQIVRHCNHRF
jgi:hypothetical protein